MQCDTMKMKLAGACPTRRSDPSPRVPSACIPECGAIVGGGVMGAEVDGGGEGSNVAPEGRAGPLLTVTPG